MAISDCTELHIFPKDSTLMSALTIPYLQSNTANVCNQYLNKQVQIYFILPALIGTCEMFIHKKEAYLQKNILKCCNLSSTRFSRTSNIIYSTTFHIPGGRTYYSKSCTSFTNSNHVPNCYFKIGKSFPWEFFPSSISPELSLTDQAIHWTGRKFNTTCQTFIPFNSW